MKSGKRNIGCGSLMMLLMLGLVLVCLLRFAQAGKQDVPQESSTESSEEVVSSEEEKSWQDEDFVFYFQDYDQPWSDYPHGTTTVSKSGCGTVSLAMCLATLTGDEKHYTPGRLARYMEKHEVLTPNVDVDSIPNMCRLLKSGCHADTYYGNLDFDLVDETLKHGGFIILDQIAETGKKYNTQVFGRLNHYVVIRGGNQEDGYYIANALYGYSKEGSKAKYAPQNGSRIPKKMFKASYYYTIEKD